MNPSYEFGMRMVGNGRCPGREMGSVTGCERVCISLLCSRVVGLAVSRLRVTDISDTDRSADYSAYFVTAKGMPKL